MSKITFWSERCHWNGKSEMDSLNYNYCRLDWNTPFSREATWRGSVCLARTWWVSSRFLPYWWEISPWMGCSWGGTWCPAAACGPPCHRSGSEGPAVSSHSPASPSEGPAVSSHSPASPVMRVSAAASASASASAPASPQRQPLTKSRSWKHCPGPEPSGTLARQLHKQAESNLSAAHLISCWI